MIEVKGNRDGETCGLDHLHGSLGHVLQEDLVGVLPSALGNLEDDRGPARSCIPGRWPAAAPCC